MYRTSCTAAFIGVGTKYVPYRIVGRKMAPMYHINLMTKLEAGAGTKLSDFLKSTIRMLWDRGAVVSDLAPWGQQELAYRCVYYSRLFCFQLF